MIPHGVEIYVGLDPIDLRWGFDRLRGVVGERVGRDARGGSLFVFFGRRRDALKVLFFDGTGMCVFYKRLDRGTFRIPTPTIANTACAVSRSLLRARQIPSRQRTSLRTPATLSRRSVA